MPSLKIFKIAFIILIIGIFITIYIVISNKNNSSNINVYYPPEANFEHILHQCSNSKNKLIYHKVSRDSDAARQELTRLLVAKDHDIDLMYLDNTWVPEFANSKWIIPFSSEYQKSVERDTLEGPLKSAMWKNKMYAVPKNTNVQLLWYRDDIVKDVPKTWDDLVSYAKELKDAGKPYKILFTGARYEGLVVNFNSMLASLNSGLLNNNGKLILDNNTSRALSTLRDVSKSDVVSSSLVNAKEDEVRLEFERGNAAFEINWPYIYESMKQDNPELFKHLKWATYPAVDPNIQSRVTIGGTNIAISRYSKHNKQDLLNVVDCLRSRESQKYTALYSGLPPTNASLYNDADIKKRYPMSDTIQEELTHYALRPATPLYNSMSTVIANILSPPYDINPHESIIALRQELNKVINSKVILP